MFVFSNPHPRGLRVTDCVKRAFVHATGESYRDVQQMLNQVKREVRAKAFNSTTVWKTVVERRGYQKLSFPAVKGESRMNGHTFTKKFPKGTYILRMAKHLSCCIDGVIYDTFDCRDKCVYTAWKVEG